MKTKTILILFVALFATALSAFSEDKIKSLKLTISYNGEQFTQSFDASGFQMLDLTAEFTNSMIIKKVEVQTQGTVSDVVFVATMNPADETPNSDNWVNMPLQWNKDGEGWVLDFGDGIELTKEIEDSQPRIFQFYVQAKNSAGSDIFYNNGGETYKVKFTYQGGGNENWKVKFYKDGTAGLGLLVNGEQWSTMYNGSVIRETGYGWNPGEVSSFILEAFYLTFIVNDNVNVEDVSIQYRVYEEGSTPSQWNGISGTLQTAKDVWNSDKNRYDHKRSYIGENLARNVLNGLILGKNYVLDVMYQVKTTDGGYVMFGKEAEGTSFHFTPVEGGGSSQQDDAVSAMTVTLTEDGVETTDYDVSGGSLVTEKGCKSLKLNNFKVTTTNEVQCVRLFYVVYPDGWSDGGPTAYDTDPNVWFKTIDATRREGSTWLENCEIDLLQDRCEGYPIQSNKNYRFYCYIGILVKGEWRYPDDYELRLDIKTGDLNATAGDVNHDGSITMADANVVVNYYLVPTEGFDFDAADVNDDGQITMADANQIVNMYQNAGK